MLKLGGRGSYAKWLSGYRANERTARYAAAAGKIAKTKSDAIAKMKGLFTNAGKTGVLHSSMLNKVDTDLLVGTANSLGKAVETFPLAAKMLGMIKSTNHLMDPGTMAWALYRTINVSPEWYQIGEGKKFATAKDAYKDYERQAASGWHPAGTTLDDNAVHELGHVIDGVISSAIGSSWIDMGTTGWSGKIVKEAYMDFIRNNRQYNGMSSKEVFKTFISAYASTKKVEAFAESIAQYVRLGKKAHPIAVYIGEATAAKLGEQSVIDYVNGIGSETGIFES